MYQQDKMTLYLAGPMTNEPKFNFPAFDTAAAAYRKLGFGVVSPAELDDPDVREAALASPDGAPGTSSPNGETWGDFLARDVKIVADEVDGVGLLPGWEHSKGARLEAWIARHVGKPVFYTVPAVWIGDDEWGERDHERVCHCAELGAAVVGDVDLVELDDAELDHVYTVADLEVLYKIAKAEGEVAPEPVDPVEGSGWHFKPDAPDITVTGGEFTIGPVELSVDEADALEGGVEVRKVDPDTGGEKGSKLARFDLIPAIPLQELAEHYGKGAEKYEDRNWERGYAWSLSFAAMQRHLWLWWSGETYDEETGSNHLTAAAWHCFALLEWDHTHPEKDDRP